MKKLTILCDLDCIVADFLEAWICAINNKFNLKLTTEDVTDWDVVSIPKLKNINPRKIYALYKAPMFFWDLLIIPGAQEALKQLHSNGHDIKFITAAATAQNAYEKMLWVDKHFPYIGQQNIILTKHKNLVKGDVFIDDKGSMCESYAKDWPNTLVLTIEYPYNSYLKENSSIKVAGHYSDTVKAWGNIVKWTTSLSQQ